jgi:hypothetical protein
MYAKEMEELLDSFKKLATGKEELAADIMHRGVMTLAASDQDGTSYVTSKMDFDEIKDGQMQLKQVIYTSCKQWFLLAIILL